MFRRLPDDPAQPASPAFEFAFDGRAVPAHDGDSIAAALLRAGVARLRHHPIDASARLPFCMMGACQECLVTIDGGAARRACLVAARAGMDVRPTGGEALRAAASAELAP